ncbi:MAG: glycosyltransferase family 39 protein [Phycisphaeraceae bacterium JB051]
MQPTPQLSPPLQWRVDLPGLILTLLTIVGMTWWSWLCWCEPITDFGRELYTPWQITQGQVLYRDMALFNGPLSQYFNALVFMLFGVSLRTLIFTNVVIFTLTVGLLYRMVRHIAGPMTATISSLTVVLLMGFNQYSAVSNFNWMCPYSHELTHGIALSLLTIWQLGYWLEKPTLIRSLIIGLLAGLVFLTKMEVFAACFGTVVVGGVGNLLLGRIRFKPWLMQCAVLLAGLLIPAVISWLLLSTAMPAKTAFLGTMGTWNYVGNVKHTTMAYFKQCMGTDDLPRQLKETVIVLLIYLLAIGPWLALCATWKRGWLWRLLSFTMLAVINLIIPMAILAQHPKQWLWLWQRMALPWPWLMSVVLGITAWQCFKNRKEATLLIKHQRLLIFALLALLMMFKIIFNARIWHYGFALSVPAAVVLTVVVFEVLPRRLPAFATRLKLTRSGLLVVWLIVVYGYLTLCSGWYEYKTRTIGQGHDQFKYSARAQILNMGIKYLQQHADPTDTLVVLPEGQMINYLTRLQSPSRYGQFTPAPITLYSEQAMLNDLANAKPTWILLAHNSNNSYDAGWFGKDHAKEIWNWITAAYRPMQRYGAPPFNPEDHFGIVIAKRADTIIPTQTNTTSPDQNDLDAPLPTSKQHPPQITPDASIP